MVTFFFVLSRAGVNPLIGRAWRRRQPARCGKAFGDSFNIRTTFDPGLAGCEN